MTPTDTPDVDAAAFEERGLPGSLVVHVDFARRLRREASGQKVEIGLLHEELKDAKAKIESDLAQYAEAQKLLEKQKAYSIALQNLLNFICGVGQANADEALAPDYKARVHAFVKQIADTQHKQQEEHTAELEAERKAHTETGHALGAKCQSLSDELLNAQQQISDLQLRLAATEELNFELAANVGKLAERVPVSEGEPE